MADIKVLMVSDGARFNFGPRQNPNGLEDDNYFGLTALYTSLQNSNTPTIQVDFAHRRGHAFAGQTAEHEDCSAGLTYPGDFVFTLANPPAPNTVTADLSTYDVLWLIGDEGYNAGSTLPTDTEITDPEKIAIANFMAGGGGVFAVGDHDGIGAYMCGKLPRVRVMRRWFEWDHPFTDPASGRQFTPNWSAIGFETTQPSQPDRNDTLRPDGDGNYYFFDQSDPNPQPLLDNAGAPLPSSSAPIHTILRDAVGSVFAQFPDHMHEGEATDFTTVASPPFNPNQSPGNPYSLTYTDANGHAVSFVEFPIVGGYQPQPEIIVYDSDSGHSTYYDAVTATPTYAATQPKRRGAVSVYDGHAAGIGRVVTGSTFHHYLDKNLLGDPGTDPMTAGHPTQTEKGLPTSVLTGMATFYVNTVTWLARPNQNFSFLTVKNMFGVDEVADAAAHGQNFSNAFYLAVDGYTPNQVGTTPSITFSGPFKAAGAAFQQSGAIPESVGSPNTPQRVLIPFTVMSIPTAAFPAAGAAPIVLPLEARATINGTPLSAEALFELVAGADPYFSNLGSDAADQWYLSQDLRVFQAGPGAPSTPFIPFPATGSGYDYITKLLTYLNDPSHGYTNSSADPFVTLSQANDLTEASSVTPSTQNFAVARVRLRGSAGTLASAVKVFFRLWTAASNDTDYDAQTTYVSTYDAAHLPDQPLPAPGGLNSPLFASSRSGTGDYDPGVNQLDVKVTSSTAETWAYFGCFLDVYNNPAVSLVGTHHCLVAQIAYDGAPIIGATGVTLSPENCGQLAQRNIQITPSGNPGWPSTHRAPQTFDLRPSLRTGQRLGSVLGYPDELMIDWGELPVGSVINIYWPQAAAIDVVRLAMILYGTDLLRVADPHTVQCKVSSRLTYVPIPFGAGENLAGLLTIDLPQGVRYGQDFRIVIRRISTRQSGSAGIGLVDVAVSGGQVDKPILSTRSGRRRSAAPAPRAAVPVMRDWRYIVGTFQVAIPVKHEEVLLRPEENILAILEWRLQQMASSDRWYPVLERYVGYVMGRVAGFGGDPATIVPSPTGVPPGRVPPGPGGETEEFTGKVCDVVFDCFGDFEGFVLKTCDATHAFASCDRCIGELALRACHQRLLISVFAERGALRGIKKVVVRG